jgi:hypothetical protein
VNITSSIIPTDVKIYYEDEMPYLEYTGEATTQDGKKIYCCDDCRYRNSVATAAKNRKVFHRSCKECGTEFDTTNGRKIFCCRECAFKSKQRDRYRREKEYGKKE